MAEGSGGKLGFIIFYVAFYLLVAYIAAGATDSGIGVSGSVTSPPVLATPDTSGSPSWTDAIVSVVDWLLYAGAYVVYFFGLQGLTLFGLGSGIAALISLPMTIGFVYCVVTLIRGGG